MDPVQQSLYQHVPESQVRELLDFRQAHPTKHLTVGRVEWEYLDCGTAGETILLLPGGARFGEAWFKLIPLMEDQFRLIAPSWPAVSTMGDLVQGTLAILDHAGVSQAHVVGTSFGGWVAQAFQRHNPTRVKTLVLSMTTGPEALPRRRLRLGLAIASAAPPVLLRWSLKRQLGRLFAKPEAQASFWRAYLQEALTRTSKADILGLLRCTLDFAENYRLGAAPDSNWAGRVLILHIAGDATVPTSAVTGLHRFYPNSQVHTFTGVGHTVGYTQPEIYLPVTQRFIAGPDVERYASPS